MVSVTIKRFCFTFVFLFGVFLNQVDANVQPYTLERGLLAPQFFEEGVEGRDVGQVFGNPAGFDRDIKTQIALDASQDFIGYDRYSLAAVFPYGRAVIGIGYMQLSANDLLNVSSSLGGTAEITGTFSDQYSLMVGTVKVRPHRGLSVGVRVGEFRHVLDDDEGKGYMVDAGFRQEFGQGFWLGAYARHLTPMKIVWEKSGEEETVERDWLYEFGVNQRPFLVTFSSSSDYQRVYGEWVLHKRFSVIGDKVWDSGFTSQRMSIGTLIDFGSFALSYLHLHYDQTDLASDQDIVGLLFRLGGSK